MRYISLVAVVGVLSVVNGALGQGTQPRQPSGPMPAAPGGAAGQAAATWQWKDLALRDRRTMSYAIVLPKGYKAGDPYPVLLAMPPGSQSRESVEQGMAKYWGAGGDRGWIVISPASPDARPIHAGNAAAADELIEFAIKEFSPPGGKLHLAGVHNGGRTAWGAILEHPEQFASLTVLPGLPADNVSPRKFAALKGTPIRMFVGEKDGSAVRESQRLVDRLKRDGLDAALTVESGEGSIINSLTPARLFDQLDAYRSGPRPAGASGPAVVDAGAGSAAAVAVGKMLDDFHDAAAKADEQRYFDHFASDGVFIGTDATERWNVEAFRAFAKPYFARGRAWTYVPVAGKRSVVLSPDGTMAFFDELLTNEQFGTCRGTGAVRRVGNDWKVVQYSLSVPIPNEKMKQVVDVIKK
jgi:predicted esterase